METRQFHVCFVCHVGQGFVIFELLKIVEAIIKGGVALSWLPPATFAVAINELRQIIVNIHILSLQRTVLGNLLRHLNLPRQRSRRSRSQVDPI